MKYAFSHSPKLHRVGTRILGLLLILSCLAYSGKDRFLFTNGIGGANWKIGQPLVTVWNAEASKDEAELRIFAVRLINRDRQLNGLPPLVEDPLLVQAAQLHAEDMKTRNYYAHVTLEGETPTDCLAAVGGSGGVGENIALFHTDMKSLPSLDFGIVEILQRDWMYSDGHRENLLNPSYTKVGFGISIDLRTRKIYAVQNFQ